jgi:hypothetical protein
MHATPTYSSTSISSRHSRATVAIDRAHSCIERNGAASSARSLQWEVRGGAREVGVDGT